MVLYSVSERIVYFIELIIPFEDAIERAFQRKKQYVELEMEAEGTRLVSTHKTSADRLLEALQPNQPQHFCWILVFEEALRELKIEPVVMAEVLADYLGS